MNSDQVVYNGPAVVQSTQQTSHSNQVHARELRHLRSEEVIEGKRATKEQQLAYEDSARASKHLAKATSKGTGWRARTHENKGEKFAARAEAHNLASMESQAEVDRARFLASQPARGTLPTSQVVNPTITSSQAPSNVTTSYLTPMNPGQASNVPVYHSH